MKTDDLIRALAADLPAQEKSVGEAAVRAVPVALAISALIFAVGLGTRPAFLSHWSVVAPKLVITATLALAAMAVAMRLTQPERPRWPVFALLILPVLAVAGLMWHEMLQAGAPGWQARAVGRNGLYCLTMIPLLSLAPLVAILVAARCGAVTRHYLAGGVAGMAAAGLGASLYALHCTDDSPLFIALWYTLATAITAGIGAVACRLAVRW